MHLWIVTIGSSDVQLISKKKCKEKGLKESSTAWYSWCSDEIKANHQLPYPCDPKRAFDDINEPYKIGARILGTVYKANHEDVQQEIFTYLTFPLLDNFVKVLEDENAKDPIAYPLPEAIALILTDQSTIFTTKEDRQEKRPYWQDTCCLEPILERYFQEKYPQAKILKFQPGSESEPQSITLKPKDSIQGLDNWNSVLDLVRSEFKQLSNHTDQDNSEPNLVYVSHQAGTPAISSAVQFCSLAQFRNSVQFLVSQEDTQIVLPPIPQSTYLGAIRQQEAKALLKRYDYSGIRDLIGLTQSKPTTPETKLLKYLLDAAEQWNFAEFQKFKKIVSDRKLLSTASFPLWRTGYESAYLAWVRLQQGSPVDAMFHSFRAVEGVTSLWAEKTYQTHVRRDPKKGLQLKYSICNQFRNLTYLFGKPDQPKQEIGAYGKVLFALLREDRNQDWQINSHISTFCKPLDRNYSGNDIFEERNNLFHRLEGLQEQELFEAWTTSAPGTWMVKVLGCLNFISGQNYQFIDFDEKELCDQAASLMVKVNQELVKAIANL